MRGNVSPVVTCQWLKQCLDSVGKNFKLLDASWNAKHTQKQEYLSKHIPGAIFYDQTRCVTPTQTLVRNVPDPDCYEFFLRSLGVSDDNHLVVYGRGDLMYAARAWWTLRAMGHPHVSLLNGGIEQWEAEGGDIESGETKYEGPEGNFKVKIERGIIKTFQQVIDLAQEKDSQLIDTRYPENFNGILPEPAETTTMALRSLNLPLPTKISRGHVPGAVNLHVSLFKTAQPSGTLKSREELITVFKNAGIDLQRPLTVMCYNGLNACVPILAASVLGKNDAALYYTMITKIAPIVTCQWLKQRLTSVGKNFKLLDASWNFKNTGKKEYLSKHIPGALFYDQTRCITPTQTLVRNVPDPHCYESFLRSLGVSADSHLVVYARGDLHTAARAWWTLRAMGHPHVSLLNGGIEQWEAEGGDMEDGETNYEGPEGNFKVKMQHGIMKTFKEITEMAQKKDTQLIDTRFPENFNGTLPEPSEMTTLALKSFDFPLPTTMNSGHVPGAINLHVSHFKTGKPSGTLKPKEELKEVFENAGIDLQRPLTVMCYNGLNACVPILAASVLGKNDAALYYGSWTDYGQRSDPSLCTRE